MKRVILTAATLMAAGCWLCASASVNIRNSSIKKEQRRERRIERRAAWLHSVSQLTETQFYSDFPYVKEVTWTEGVFSEANFRDGEIAKTAYYDINSELVGTTTNVPYSSLPAAARKYIEKKYPGYTTETVVLFDDNKANDTDMFLFNNRFEDQDSYFPVLSKDGKEIILQVSMDGNVSFFRDYK